MGNKIKLEMVFDNLDSLKTNGTKEQLETEVLAILGELAENNANVKFTGRKYLTLEDEPLKYSVNINGKVDRHTINAKGVDKNFMKAYHSALDTFSRNAYKAKEKTRSKQLKGARELKSHLIGESV